jgi:hypothetical protein
MLKQVQEEVLGASVDPLKVLDQNKQRALPT